MRREKEKTRSVGVCGTVEIASSEHENMNVVFIDYDFDYSREFL